MWRITDDCVRFSFVLYYLYHLLLVLNDILRLSTTNYRYAKENKKSFNGFSHNFGGVSTDLSEVLLRFQKLLFAGLRVGQQLVPALHECGVAGLNGLGLHVFGSKQLVFKGGDVGNALLLEGLQTSIKGLLQR